MRQAVAPAVLLLAGTPAAAQQAQALIEAEAASDWRVRGLSWSNGRPTIAGSARAPIAAGFEVDARATALRDDPRHGGADVGIDLGARHVSNAGGWRWSIGATGHVFAGASGVHYGEVEGSAAYTIGPATVAANLAYAPSQEAIGGDNLYVSGSVRAAIARTPLSLVAGAGHTSGDRADPRSARLRPGGDYRDWRLGVDYVRAALTLGARLTGTSIQRAARAHHPHAGTQLSLLARVTM